MRKATKIERPVSVTPTSSTARSRYEEWLGGNTPKWQLCRRIAQRCVDAGCRRWCSFTEERIGNAIAYHTKYDDSIDLEAWADADTDNLLIMLRYVLECHGANFHYRSIPVRAPFLKKSLQGGAA